MAGSSATIPIVVAVIGVLGAIIPIAINSLVSQEFKQPSVQIRPPGFKTNTTEPIANNLTQYVFRIINTGNAPATNLSIAFNVFPMNIVNITDKLSTTLLILPEFNNRVLQTGDNQTVSGPSLKIQIPKLIQGLGSIILLDTFINGSDEGESGAGIYAIYDQGSTFVSLSSLAEPLTPMETIDEYIGNPLFFYATFYGGLAISVGFYFLQIRRMRRLPSRIAKGIIEIRRVLLNDRTHKDTFKEIWELLPKKRRTIDSIGDYLLIDDFNTELRKRNLYLSSDTGKEKSGLSRNNTLLKLNEDLLAAAENVLKNVDWNKYR